MRRREFIAGLGAAGMPYSAIAQPAMRIIGFLHSGEEGPNANRLVGFRKGLNDAGFVEKQNLTIEYRWADGKADRLPELVAELVRRPVEVIVAVSSQPATLAAKVATVTIPIVFTWPGDPVAAGLVASLNRPGGNATGIATLNDELAAKRLGLLRELLPQAAPIFVLFNPADPSADTMLKSLRAYAGTMGVQLQLLYASTDSEIEAAFATLAQRPGCALLVNADPFFFIRRLIITALAARHAVPVIYYDREFAVSSGLMTYGASLPVMWGQAGSYVARILKGEKPAELPVAQPTKFEMVINLKTAKALGLIVPDRLMALADEVIE